MPTQREVMRRPMHDRAPSFQSVSEIYPSAPSGAGQLGHHATRSLSPFDAPLVTRRLSL